jgi:hypothetical protein
MLKVKYFININFGDIFPRLWGISVLGLAGYAVGLLLAGWLILKIVRKK